MSTGFEKKRVEKTSFSKHSLDQERILKCLCKWAMLILRLTYETTTWQQRGPISAQWNEVFTLYCFVFCQAGYPPPVVVNYFYSMKRKGTKMVGTFLRLTVCTSSVMYSYHLLSTEMSVKSRVEDSIGVIIVLPWRVSDTGPLSLVESRPVSFMHGGAFRPQRTHRLCKQRAPQKASPVISCFASWMGMVGTVCLRPNPASQSCPANWTGDVAKVSIRAAPSFSLGPRQPQISAKAELFFLRLLFFSPHQTEVGDVR